MSNKRVKELDAEQCSTSTNSRKRLMQPILKILYIETGLEEKVASVHLEAVVSRLLGIPCMFTVVPSCFLALETCEHTDFDAIFACGHSLKHITAFDFLRIFRSIGGLAPIFVISEYYDEIQLEDWLVDGKKKTKYQFSDPPRFNGKLHKPFTKKEICGIVVQLYQTIISDSMPLKDISNYSSPPPAGKRFQHAKGEFMLPSTPQKISSHPFTDQSFQVSLSTRESSTAFHDQFQPISLYHNLSLMNPTISNETVDKPFILLDGNATPIVPHSTPVSIASKDEPQKASQK